MIGLFKKWFGKDPIPSPKKKEVILVSEYKKDEYEAYFEYFIGEAQLSDKGVSWVFRITGYDGKLKEKGNGISRSVELARIDCQNEVKKCMRKYRRE